MKSNWLTFVLILIGGILLLFASAMNEPLNSSRTLWFKIAGIIILMTGVYRAYKGSAKNESNPENDEDRG